MSMIATAIVHLPLRYRMNRLVTPAKRNMRKMT
jgi:hypothetical protein